LSVLDFYDKNSVTCTSEYFDPSRESDFLERNLQHSGQFFADLKKGFEMRIYEKKERLLS